MSNTLLYPYTYENRKPLFQDGVLFIPEFFTEEDLGLHRNFRNPEWDGITNHLKIQLEICSGNGQWIVEQAKKYPEYLWIACEVRYDRVKKIYKRAKAENVTNLVVAFGYAETLLNFYVKNQSLEAIYVNFPDPWPKKRHAKHRLFQSEFIQNISRSLKHEAVISLTTDDTPYLEDSIANLIQGGLFPVYELPHYQVLDPEYGTSFFHDLWLDKGKKNYITKFKKL